MNRICSGNKLRHIFDQSLTTHGLGYQIKVLCRNLDKAEAKSRAPVCLVLDERQRVDQWPHWRLTAFEELDVNSIRLKVRCHLHVIDLPGSDLAYSSECLKYLSGRIGSAWRIQDQTIAGVKSLERRFLPVIELNEAALHRDLYVRARDHAYPEVSIRQVIHICADIYSVAFIRSSLIQMLPTIPYDVKCAVIKKIL